MSIVTPSVVGASTGAQLGTIRWEVDKDSISKENSFSDTIEVGAIQWALCLCKRIEDGDQLSAYLYQIEGDYEVHSVRAAMEIKLINHDDGTKSARKKCEELFVKIDHWGFTKLIKWSDVIDDAKGFIKNGKFTVLCDFSLLTIRGFRKLRRVDFTHPNEPSSDVTLVIDGEKFYVSKPYLSILSPVFQAMFYGKFAEKNQKEIELKDIDKKEFTAMLSVIYPPHKKITNDNFGFLLKLGDRFQIDMITKEVEQYLIASITNTDCETLTDKILVAEQFRLHKLMDHCVSQFITVKDVTDLKNSRIFNRFSDTTKAILLEKIITLAD